MDDESGESMEPMEEVPLMVDRQTILFYSRGALRIVAMTLCPSVCLSVTSSSSRVLSNVTGRIQLISRGTEHCRNFGEVSL